MLKKMMLGLGLVSLMAVASGETINNAGTKRLQQEALALLSQTTVSEQASANFLKRNRFDLEDVNWKQPAQVIHGPYHMVDGDEEADNVPYVFAFNQGKTVAGVAGWLKPAFVKQLQALPTLKCSTAPKDRQLWVCAHTNTPASITQKFVRDLSEMMENAN